MFPDASKIAGVSRFSRELWRKLFHLCGLLIPLGYFVLQYFFDQQAALLGLTGLLLVLMEIEYVRLEHDVPLPLRFGVLLRRHEKDRVTGAIWLTAACIISFAVFDERIALLAFFFVIFGDLFASLTGMLVGGPKFYRRKTWSGLIGGVIANLVCGALLLPEMPAVYVPMALTASLVEALTSKLDDNFTVPLFSGFTGYMMMIVLEAVGLL